ncbi:CatA-like O-acetyltransferase [Zunongwangia pacifica]|uniref:Chloramphenicol acetyltransferase n=1 Tax=Zunongwangia pacifica TaxID=2911062 RepID=A0A9X1ZUL1_9FLAO|nr:CatA-like O-acetyltransferase [Zunongwangia pacifica]MCL6220401.1 chloramphenicol acetyltransferase [Zunongwangia pacifica]
MDITKQELCYIYVSGNFNQNRLTKRMKAVFTPVSIDWKRKPYFDYFFENIKTKYNITHHIDITSFYSEVKNNNLKFYPSFLFVIMKIVNQNEEFRMSFNENGNLGFWNYVNPSYTIFHDDDKTFSDIWSEYKPTFIEFYQEIINDIEKYKNIKKIKAKENRPANFCPVSTIPWLSFESFSQDTYHENSFLYPIIRFGKYYQKEKQFFIPLSLFVNHAVADGYHTCKLINEIEEFGKNIKEWMNK